MMARMMTAEDAIRESASHDCVAHVLAVGTVQADLLSACEDWTDAGEDQDGDRIYEYWGTDGDGDAWRVHVHGATAH